MKRPLAVVGLIYLAVSAAAVCLFPELNLILFVAAVVIAIAACFLYREKTRDILLTLCPACIAFLVIGCCQLRANAISDRLDGQSGVISGEVCEIPKRQYGKWRYVIETDSVDIPGANQKLRILLTSRLAIEEAKEGDRITCEAHFLQGSGETGYSSTSSLRADGITVRAWCNPYASHQIQKGGFRVRYLPLAIRRAVISRVRRTLPDRASAMLCGMLLGDTDYMDNRTIECFRSTGIGHLLAVSGFHLTLLTLTLTRLLRRLRLAPKGKSLTVISFILLFMAVTGFTPSVVRAGIMHLLAHFAHLFRRDADSLTSLSVSILVMCLLNPWAAADIGLQLSVCATLGLMFLSDRIEESLTDGARRLLLHAGKMPEHLWMRQSGKRVIRVTAASIAASLAILPLTAIHFGSVSLISPVTNLLCIYIASVFLIVGISASLIICVPFVGWLISLPFRLAAAVLCAYLEAVSGGLAGLPLSSVNTDFSYMPSLFLFAALLIVCAFFMNHRLKSEAFARRLRRFVCCELAVLLFVGALSHQLLCTGAEIIVFDANGGVCVCAKNRTHAVFAEAGGDGYGLSVIRQTLREKGVRKVDAIAVSDDSMARSGNVYRLLEAYLPDYLITDADFRVKAEEMIQPYESSVNNSRLSIRLDTFIDSKGGRWQRITCGKTSAVICPEKGSCALLPAEWRSCDAVIVGKDVSGIAVMNAGAVIVSANEKNARALCIRLRSMGWKHVYSTAESGSMALSVRNGKLHIRTE